MADAFTGQAAMSLDQAAYEQNVLYALRPQLYFDQVVDVRPTNVTQPGSSVAWTFITDMAAATTALTETSDVDAVALADSQSSVTLAEYGNAINTTAKLRGTAFTNVESIAANALGFNAGLSVDTLARNVVQAGSNVRYASATQSRVSVAATDTLKAIHFRRTLADMKGANVDPASGNLYGCFIHPDQEYDVRGETGAAAWRDPHTYSQPAEIWSGETGAFEGSRVITTPRSPLFVDGGVGGTVDVYGAIFFGKQAIGKAWAMADGNGPEPRVVASPVVDKLRRFVPIGWYWFGGYLRIREAALRRFETASSIGAN